MITLTVFWIFLIPAKIIHADNIETKIYTPIYNDTFKRCEFVRKQFTSLPKCFKVVE